jgi:hydrophobic/amphiphilic exporter-1 (mainly G- bacteria), HAE1 family
MPLAKLAIKQPVFVTMVLIAVTLVGVLCYFNMGVELFPNISPPIAMVSVSYPGASPQDVETLVTKPLEQTLSTVSGVNRLESTSSQGSCMVMIEFAVGYNLQQGVEDIRGRLDSFQRSLPNGAKTPVLNRFDPSSMPFMSVALNISGNPTPVEQRQLIEQVIEPRMQQVSGVASADVSGYPTQIIRVDLIASKLKALHVSPAQVMNALSAQNVTMPSGTITSPDQSTSVRVTAGFQTMDEIGRIVVARYGTRDVRLNEVAAVSPQLKTQTTLVRYNGQSAMVLDLKLQSGGNVVQTAGRARVALDNLEKSFPSIHFTIISDTSTFIEESNRDVMITLIIGAILAFLIVLLFIRNFRNTLITVAGLPVIVLGTFAVISALGYTLNIVTLMALSLSIGLLIDDAIVVRENIFRHMEHGESPREAADKGTGEIAFAVIAISLTVAAVFIPVAFTSGQIGDIFKEFGITVAVAILISLFEAFTFAPLLTAYFAKPLKIQSGEAGEKSRQAGRVNIGKSVSRGYRSILTWSLHFRWAVVGMAVILLASSVWILARLPIGFFPTTDEGQISVGIMLPPGSPLEKTNQIALAVEKVVLAQPEVSTVYSSVGSGGSAYSGSISIQLKDGAITDDVIKRLRSSLKQYGASLIFSKPSSFMGVGMGGGGPGGASIRGRPVQIDVKGPVSVAELDAVADQVAEKLKTVPGIRDVGKSLPPQMPELKVAVDRQRLADAGISATTVGNTISTLVEGSTATQIEWEGLRTDVIVSLRSQDISNQAALMDISIPDSSGNLYPLSSLASVTMGTGPAQLSRSNQQASITVGANLDGKTVAQITPEIQKALADLSLPAGITWAFGGMQANATSAYGSLIIALIMGLVFVYMVLASQFGSFIHPFTVMVALPLAIIGSSFAILVTHIDLTMIYMIGIILMMGLATKNSILLVDFIIRYRKQGKSRTEAVLEAGPVRLRPILMTTLSIILGMIPTAVGWGASGTFRSPMAIAVIGGQITCTLLSLVVIPVVYTLVDDGQVAVGRLFHRGRAASAAAAEAPEGLPEHRDVSPEVFANGGEKSPRQRWWKRKGGG